MQVVRVGRGGRDAESNDECREEHHICMCEDSFDWASCFNSFLQLGSVLPVR